MASSSVASRTGATLPGASRAGVTRIRTEIQALRALAVTAVVLNHLWPGTVTGGFVGVDVFFVISGFLITDHLLRELDRTDRIDLPGFWARRARRLLPASLLVLAVTAAASLALFPTSRWTSLMAEAAGSATYVQNWILAANSVDYFASQRIASPFTHFWSLSVEEQFYLIWPLAIVAAAVVAVRLARRRRTVVGLLLGVIVVASLAFSVVFTHDNPAQAYFVTPGRAWEFGLGGLLAVARITLPASPRIRGAVAWVGWLAILASVVRFDEHTPMPGAIALIPTLGAAAVIVAGTVTSTWSPAPLTDFGPVQLLGKISYSLYLWHWPVIVLLPMVIRRPLGVPGAVLAIAISLALAWITQRWVEDPVRTLPAMTKARPRRTFAFAAAGMAVVLAIAGTGAGVYSIRAGSAEAQIAAVAKSPPPCFGAASRLDPACAGKPAPAGVIPQPLVAATDWADAFDCYDQPDATTFTTCTLVDGKGPHVALVGDSHGAMLIPAIEKVARAEGWRLDVYVRSACPLTTADVFFDAIFESQCATYRAKLFDRLDGYDAVIATAWSQLSVDDPQLPDGERVKRLAVGYADAWSGLESAGVEVFAVRDNPIVPRGLAGCVDRSPDPSKCVGSRADSLPDDPIVHAAAMAPATKLVDLTDVYCRPDGCPLVIGGALVHFDAHHLTATFSRTLAPALAQRIRLSR